MQNSKSDETNNDQIQSSAVSRENESRHEKHVFGVSWLCNMFFHDAALIKP